MSQENIEIVRRLYERVAAGDIEGELEFIHPDIELFPREDEPNARVYRGRDGYREYVTFWDDVWDDYEVEIEEYIDAGEYLVVVGRARGKGRSSGLRLEDIQAFDKPMVWLWRFCDGMGIERREYRTKAEALAAIGLSE